MKIIVKRSNNCERKQFSELKNGAIFKSCNRLVFDEYYMKIYNTITGENHAVGLTSYGTFIFDEEANVIPLDATLEIVDVI